MPGTGTHTTIIQHLAQSNAAYQAALGNPLLNSSWGSLGYSSAEALKSRYSILGAMGPDVFYAMADSGANTQGFENAVVQIAGTFECVGEVLTEMNNLVSGTLNVLTGNVWSELQTTLNLLGDTLEDGILDAIVTNFNFWSLFLPLRQVDDYEQNWYWADFLHYAKTGCFVQRLLDLSRTYSSDPQTTACLQAYSLGYLTHYVSDTIGHAYVNLIVGSPYRNCWQRHHLVENFIDAYVWDEWHNPSTALGGAADPPPLDVILDQSVANGSSRSIGDGSPLHYARLNDLCNIGSIAPDTILNSAIESACQAIQKGLSVTGASVVSSLQQPNDPIFLTWTQFIADAIKETFPSPTGAGIEGGLQNHPIRLAGNTGLFAGCGDAGGYPTSTDVADAYSVYRILLYLVTEDNVPAPVLPNIGSELSSVITQLMNQVNQAIGNVGPPPSISSGGLSLSSIWQALVSLVAYLAKVFGALAQIVGALIEAAIAAGTTVASALVQGGLYLLNSALYSIYKQVRMPLVLSAYAAPLTEDLQSSIGALDLSTLWQNTNTQSNLAYPIEPVVAQRNLAVSSTPYFPFFPPTSLSGNIEFPPITYPSSVLGWTTPDDMLGSVPIGASPSMFRNNSTAQATSVTLSGASSTRTGGSTNINVSSFDGSNTFFGGVFFNCEAALNAVIPYLSGRSLPGGFVFPDYNLDSDRGFAWPCWDVGYLSNAPPFPWNGCDPFPQDTLTRASAGGPTGLNWGSPAATARAAMPPAAGGLNYQGTDPIHGAPRNGNAWINAMALNQTSTCSYGSVFSVYTINPNAAAGSVGSALSGLDSCSPVTKAGPQGQPLPPDYQLAMPNFSSLVDTGAYNSISSPGSGFIPSDENVPVGESLGRLTPWLMSQIGLNCRQMLANAASLSIGGTITAGPGVTPTPAVPSPVTPMLWNALAQLAVTGRNAFNDFVSVTPQDSDPGLISMVTALAPGKTPSQVQNAISTVLDTAYTALWAIRSNNPGWRAFRSSSQLGGYIAVAGFADTPHRPVNVPTAPYPQYDITFNVTKSDGSTLSVTTRYMIASAGKFVGPNNASVSSFTDPDQALLQAPATAFSATPAPRTIPQDTPSIPAGDDIIIYIHGGGSRAEEGVNLASWLIVEGAKVRQNYTVISFDLPNSAYATPFQVTDVILNAYDPSKLQVLNFEAQFIQDFIEALDAQLGNVKSRIVAVMGGSLGGNMSLLLSMNAGTQPFLNTIVAWSVTCAAPSVTAGVISNGWIAKTFSGLMGNVTSSESPNTEQGYITNMYTYPLNNFPNVLGPNGSPVPPYIPPQPIMWYRGFLNPVDLPWRPCKDSLIAQTRFDRYEIYSDRSRHWASAVDLESVYLSFQDECRYQQIASSPGTHLLLASGDADNYSPNQIFNSTINLAQMMRLSANGIVELWTDTGHSFHDERPHAFAVEIVHFLTNLSSPATVNGTLTNLPTQAPASETQN